MKYMFCDFNEILFVCVKGHVTLIMLMFLSMTHRFTPIDECIYSTNLSVERCRNKVSSVFMVSQYKTQITL